MVAKKIMMLLFSTVVVNGCDISYYQGDINAIKMKQAGIKAVIIRAGYGTTIDKRFVSYINALIKVGIAVGVYWFIYAANTAEAKSNAKKCLEVITPYKDYITCGVWADWEYDSDKRAGALTPVERSVIVDVFNQEIENADFEAGIYSNQDYIRSGKFTASLVAKYPLWFAKYTSDAGNYANRGKSGKPYLWQYTSSGNGNAYGVSSIHLDLDKFYISLEPSASTPPTDKVSQNPNMIKAMDNPYIEPTRIIYYKPNKTIQYGDDVKWVQWHLWRFGLFLTDGVPNAGKIDGYFGQESHIALLEAQKRLGLVADGMCGKNTIEKFKSI